MVNTKKISDYTNQATPADASELLLDEGLGSYKAVLISALRTAMNTGATIVGALSAAIDNILINGNTISSTDTNGDINIVPNGTGDLVLGSTSTASMQIKIKSTASGNAKLEFGDPDDENIGQIQYNHATDQLDFYAGNTSALSLDSSGSVLMPNLDGGASGSDARYNTSNGVLFYDTSAIKYKENVRELIDTSFIYDIPIVMYDRIDKSKMDEIGIIANELEKIAPEYCCYDKAGEIESYNKSDLVPALINEVQKLNKRINELETK